MANHVRTMNGTKMEEKEIKGRGCCNHKAVINTRFFLVGLSNDVVAELLP